MPRPWRTIVSLEEATLPLWRSLWCVAPTVMLPRRQLASSVDKVLVIDHQVELRECTGIALRALVIETLTAVVNPASTQQSMH